MLKRIFQTKAVQYNEPISLSLKVFEIIKEDAVNTQKCNATDTFTKFLIEMAQSHRG